MALWPPLRCRHRWLATPPRPPPRRVPPRAPLPPRSTHRPPPPRPPYRRPPRRRPATATGPRSDKRSATGRHPNPETPAHAGVFVSLTAHPSPLMFHSIKNRLIGLTFA